MRRQLRPFWSDEEAAKFYAHQFRSDDRSAHVERVDNTVQMAVAHIESTKIGSPTNIADMAAGDGEIARRIGEVYGADVLLGDITPGYPIVGPIEETLRHLQPSDTDLIVLTEILEHVKDPDLVLRWARRRGRKLLVSTPVGESDDKNWEHYWGWDVEDIRVMLEGARWRIKAQWNFTPESDSYYTFQNWIAI